MKRPIIHGFIAVVTLLGSISNGEQPQPADPVKLTPRPKMVAWEQGKLQLTKATKIMYSGEGAKVAAESLGEKLRPATGYPFVVAGPPPANAAFFGILLELQENVKWDLPCCKLFDLPDDAGGITK